MTGDALWKFPCDFPLKVMGKQDERFRTAALDIVHKHVAATEVLDIAERSSKDGKYLSVTYTIKAQSKAQLDELYLELTSNEHVLLVL